MMLISGTCAKLDVQIVVRFAAFTRVLSLVLQAVLNALIPDHAADAFRPPRAEQFLILDRTVEVLFGGLGRWDAEHFLFIAERGYLYEHNFAFFPLFPLVLRAVAAGLLWPLSPFLTVRGRLLLAVAVVNSALFMLSAVALYGLSRAVLRERKLALISSLIYCLTPANVFMLAGYSESLFAALTFGALLLLERGFTLGASLILALATATRANGLVSAGFLVYLSLQKILTQGRVFRKGSAWHQVQPYASATLELLPMSIIYVLVVTLPFCLFQAYSFSTFCKPSVTHEQVSTDLLKLAEEKGYRVPDAATAIPSWCMKTFPVLYSYIQDVYWDVGFLRYFQLKQIPNFLLALPVVTLGTMALYVYVTADPWYCLHLGLSENGKKKEDGKSPTGFYSPKVFVYVVHFSVLLIFGFFCMHVQVLTRFCASSSPVLFWICSHVLLSHEPLLQNDKTFVISQEGPEPQFNKENIISNPVTLLLRHWRSCSRLTHCILGYFISYWLLGLVLHCNFLPWT